MRLACLLLMLCLASCAQDADLIHLIQTGPAAFVPPDHPALLAAEAESAEHQALLQILAGAE